MFCTFAWGSIASLYARERSATRFSAASRSKKTPSRVGSFARTMFSATVMTGISMKCWWTIPIPLRIASFAEEKATGFSLILISPSSGWYRP
jgi:hypothetical protein